MARHTIPLRKKLSVLVQLLILAGAAAWVAYIVIERGTPKQYDKSQWTQQNGFLAISYGGLSRNKKGVHLPREEFQKHLEALEENGFESISTEDVEAFYRDGTPLPDRAVYIMFEGARKDSAIFGQEGLIQTGMRATMFISTGLMSEWNRTFLKKAQIGTLGKSRYWDIGSSGHQMYADNPGDKDGDRAYFLANYLRDAEGKRSESLAEYRERAENDYQESIRILERLTKKQPDAYLFIPSNTLNNSMPRELSAVNRDLLKQHFSLAFTREGIAYNSGHEDPYKLTRLRVSSTTTPEQLIELVECWLPNFRPYRSMDNAQLRRWYTNHGKLMSADMGLSLQSDINLNGFAWLVGSDNWRNITLSANLQLQRNTEHSIYLRYAGRESFVRIAIRPDLVRIQERVKDQGLSTLASLEIPEENTVAGKTTKLEARLVNNRLALSVNGDDLLPNALPLQSESPGVLALGVNPYGDNDDDPNTEGTTITAAFGDIAAQPLLERWKRVATAEEINAVKTASESAYAGLLVDLSSLEIDTALIAELLRVADAGWRRIAVLPAGSVDTGILNREIPGLPAGLAGGLWSGVILTPANGKQAVEMSANIIQIKDEGLLAGLCLNAVQAREAARDKAPLLPVDFLLLPDNLDAASTTSLKRRYENLFFESDNKIFVKGQ